MRLWWLSFVDKKPDGVKFLGVACVRGVDMKDAIRVAHLAGCNPGGEVQGAPVDLSAAPPHTMWYKLLTKQQLLDAGCKLGEKEVP